MSYYYYLIMLSQWSCIVPGIQCSGVYVTLITWEINRTYMDMDAKKCKFVCDFLHFWTANVKIVNIILELGITKSTIHPLFVRDLTLSCLSSLLWLTSIWTLWFVKLDKYFIQETVISWDISWITLLILGCYRCSKIQVLQTKILSHMLVNGVS